MIQGTVEAIFVARYGGTKMARVSEVEALAGFGLKGDRYSVGAGYWSGIDECQVTLIAGEDLDEISATTGIRVQDGEHRRNLVTRGVRLADLAGKKFKVGRAVLEYDRPRPPCTYIESLTEPGMARALARRAGICARVLESGPIRVGDRIEIGG
ncbi:MAG TPA: MOSC domain-containing protein [Candidatus Acidoferrales bacterium]|nr:MOSC domain-containing protein [Candidatus Acidoferrales bacterium]